MRKWADKYRLRLERKAFLFRAKNCFRKLQNICDNTAQINRSDVLVFSQCDHSMKSTKAFLEYYRDIGIRHFLLLLRDRNVEVIAFLKDQKDVSCWIDDHENPNCLNGMLRKFGVNHWCLTVRPNERFVFPHMDRRPLPALTDWLSKSNKKSLAALQIDTYEHADDTFFDHGNILYSRHSKYQNLIAQGGVRQRVTFADAPQDCENLARLPLVFWAKSTVYVDPYTTLLPRGLNNAYATNGGQEICAAIVVPSGVENAGTENSTKLKGWRQLEEFNLLSRGQWA